jgi:hypothetical protein
MHINEGTPCFADARRKKSLVQRGWKFFWVKEDNESEIMQQTQYYLILC